MKVYNYKLIQKFKIPIREIKTLSKERMNFLVASFDGVFTVTALRLKALILSLISTGCRIGELLALNRQDIDFSTGIASVVGKGDKIRPVIFSNEALSSLNEYFKKRTDSLPVLFATANTNNPKTWQCNDVERTMRNYGRKIGLEQNLHPHLLRRSAATLLFHQNAPLPVVKRFLGHTVGSSATHKYYLGEIGFDEVQDFHRKIMIDFDTKETGTEKGGEI